MNIREDYCWEIWQALTKWLCFLMPDLPRRIQAITLSIVVSGVQTPISLPWGKRSHDHWKQAIHTAQRVARRALNAFSFSRPLCFWDVFKVSQSKPSSYKNHDIRQTIGTRNHWFPMILDPNDPRLGYNFQLGRWDCTTQSRNSC